MVHIKKKIKKKNLNNSPLEWLDGSYNPLHSHGVQVSVTLMKVKEHPTSFAWGVPHPAHCTPESCFCQRQLDSEIQGQMELWGFLPSAIHSSQGKMFPWYWNLFLEPSGHKGQSVFAQNWVPLLPEPPERSQRGVAEADWSPAPAQVHGNPVGGRARLHGARSSAVCRPSLRKEQGALGTRY